MRVALETEARKTRKYSQLLPMHDFCPFVVEMMSVWGSEAIALVKELGRRTTMVTGEVRLAAFIRQRIDIALQRGNAASVLGTVMHLQHWDELQCKL